MKNQLNILGSGTCNIVSDKAAASVLIEKNNLKMVYDFGRGTAVRLVEAGLRQDDITHIFISHFHPDHVTDLYPYLHAASWSQIDPRTEKLHVYGPAGTEKFVSKMLDVFGREELNRNFKMTVKDVNDGLMTLENEQFQVVDLHHSRGLRFDDFAIAGDASISDALIRLLKGAKLGIFDSGHIRDEEIIDLAVAIQAKRLVCSHQYRKLDESWLNHAASAKGYRGVISVGHDLMELRL